MHELYLLALCMNNIDYIEKVNLKTISDKNIASSLEQLKMYGDAAIHNILPIFDDLTQVTLKTAMLNYEQLSNEVLNEKFIKYSKQANYTLQKKNALAVIEEAKTLIEKHYINDGIAKLKNLSFTENKQFKSTKDLMKETVQVADVFQTGIPQIDNKIKGFGLANVLTLVGDSGQMKTMFSLWLISQILVHNPNFKGMFFEKEMATTEIVRRMISMLLKLEMSEILGMHANMTNTEEKEAIAELDHQVEQAINSTDNKYADAFKRLTVIPQEAFENAKDMWSIIESHNVDIWALDYLTMLSTTERDYNKFMEDQIRTFKSIVLDTNSFGIILGQIKQGSLTDSYVKIPDIDQIEYGKKLRQLSSWVYATYYPYFYGHTEDEKMFFAVCRKNRNNNPEHFMLNVHKHICSYTDRQNTAVGLQWLANTAMNPKAMKKLMEE